MTSETETAAQACARNLRAARELVDRIADHLIELELGNDRPAGLHWGHVGDMAETVKGLRAVSDRMFSEGEYAPLPAEQCIVCGDVVTSETGPCACADR